MPEGPSIVILKEQLLPLQLEGEIITSVSGNTSIDKERLVGQQLQQFKTWGKHFLVCFKDFTLRVHFMLFGTYRINERTESQERLSLKFDGAEINFYTCSLLFIEGNINEVYDWTADVMSPAWDDTAAFNKLLKKPKLLVCDALLDQQVFSGVGNIIKNEVLYRIKVHPATTIGALPKEKLVELIEEARNYSFDFLKWKKEFTLKKHWLAHTRKVCHRCDLPIHKEYLGKTNRRTYFCNNCQKFYKTV